jgi:2-oxoglutarate dehydrogenase E1 component
LHNYTISTLENPDSVEPSLRSFFQGFDFGVETYNENPVTNNQWLPALLTTRISEKLQKSLMY